MLRLTVRHGSTEALSHNKASANGYGCYGRKAMQRIRRLVSLDLLYGEAARAAAEQAAPAANRDTAGMPSTHERESTTTSTTTPTTTATTTSTTTATITSTTTATTTSTTTDTTSVEETNVKTRGITSCIPAEASWAWRTRTPPRLQGMCLTADSSTALRPWRGRHRLALAYRHGWHELES